MVTLAEKMQKQLLEQAQFIYYQNPISEPTQKAYLATPRHLFVKRYREVGTKEWNEVNEDNLESHLARLYQDKALVLFGEDPVNLQSTISQPSFVLRILDMLQLKPGQKVFELGAGSGWNAALMGHLVGPEGHVYSLEILPEAAGTAWATIKQLGINNVSIIEADGGEGYSKEAPYDRAIFTAGTYDLPHHFFEQIVDGGLLLVIIKNEGGGDNLFLMCKKNDHFESVEAMNCGFVQMTGKYRVTDLDPVVLETLPEWPALREQEKAKRKFWWGAKGSNWWDIKTLGIRSFLAITEPLFKTFKAKIADGQLQEEMYFGLWDKENLSLAVVKDDRITAYGSSVAEQRLMQDINDWVNMGMPNAACFDLKIYPGDITLHADEYQWIVRRNESQFLWSLKGWKN
jgi:protein-L-isoaspartate(D-aspartate) O-methyltransferase